MLTIKGLRTIYYSEKGIKLPSASRECVATSRESSSFSPFSWSSTSSFSSPTGGAGSTDRPKALHSRKRQSRVPRQVGTFHSKHSGISLWLPTHQPPFKQIWKSKKPYPIIASFYRQALNRLTTQKQYTELSSTIIKPKKETNILEFYLSLERYEQWQKNLALKRITDKW